MTDPLIRLTDVWREYATGDHVVSALKNVNVTIETGEFVAIIGPSGSGKSTMMNILGCLDKPTRGTYKVAGRDVADLTPDELAGLRREHFGFIFQRYHLLADLNAQGNVEVPAVYAGWSRGKRHQRAQALLGRLGLCDRLHHHPNQLSGGQQQRVSVARALMNGGEVILADEPTGALDSRSGEEMLRILDELSAEGHTVILVTHDSKVAGHAHRVITISDGEIVSDVMTDKAVKEQVKREHKAPNVKTSWAAGLDRLGEALRMALAAMNAHRLRTFLTMLGIIIGIASVVSIVALGDGSKEKILAEISTIGSNTVTLYPGKSAGDPNAADIHTLNLDDVKAISSQIYADSLTPAVNTEGLIRSGSVSTTVAVNGVGEQSFRVRNVKMAAGRVFSAEDVASYNQALVIDDATRKKLFAPAVDPIGKVVIISGVPFEVLGVTAKTDSLFFGSGDTLNVWAPYSTVNARLLHAEDLHSITVRLADTIPTQVAMDAMERLVSLRHGTTDFYMVSSDSVRRTIENVTLMLSLLIGAIGGISLMVGGLGVMNIMLVSVSERTREIGVRTAIGARRSDIMSQFIIEAILVCLMGGTLGVGLALLIGQIFEQFVKEFQLVYSPSSIIAAFAVSSLIGLVFGWLPARNAARLDPIEALARE